MTFNQSKYRGKRAFLSKLPNCRLEMAPDGQTVKILIIPEAKPKIASGNYKTVKKVHRFDLMTHLKDGQRNYRHFHRALLGVRKKNNLDDVRVKENSIKQDYNIQLELSKLSSIRIAELPQPLFPLASQNKLKKPSYELEQKRYIADFHTALHESGVPISFSSDEVKNITTLDKLTVLYLIAQTCFKLHNHAVVHGDIKPGNILLDLNTDGNVKPVLTDFNLCKMIGYEDFEGEFEYWDTCRTKGWATPFCDIYGLTISLGEIFIPNFLDKIAKDRTLLNDLTKRELIISNATGLFIEDYFEEEEIVKIFGSLDECSPSKCREKIEAYLNDHFDQEDRLIDIDRSLILLEAVLNFIFNVVDEDKKIYKFLKSNKELQEELNSTLLEQKLSAVKKIEGRFSLANPNEFLSRLRAFINLYNQNFVAPLNTPI